MNARLIPLLGTLLLVAACAKAPEPPAATKAVAVKVVVVSMFEIGEDQGDTAGEF